jgi:hypothetical protein
MIWTITTIKYCNYTEAKEISPMDQHSHNSTDLSHYYVLPASYTHPEYSGLLFDAVIEWVAPPPMLKGSHCLLLQAQSSLFFSIPELHDPPDEGTMILRNARNYLPNSTASHPT